MSYSLFFACLYYTTVRIEVCLHYLMHISSLLSGYFTTYFSALGKSRDLGGLGANFRSNDEAEQTLNQLLACMDGLDSSKRVCVLAATNRREVLDPALVRPGRFDRIIKVNLPDVQERERILRVHAKKLPGFTECKGIDDKRPGR